MGDLKHCFLKDVTRLCSFMKVSQVYYKMEEKI